MHFTHRITVAVPLTLVAATAAARWLLRIIQTTVTIIAPFGAGGRADVQSPGRPLPVALLRQAVAVENDVGNGTVSLAPRALRCYAK